MLGFPCNQFGAQEPGTEDEIATFCESNFDVTFPMFAKVDVNGDDAAPLYRYLKTAKPGLLGSEAIKWNFTKFLVDRKGKVVARYRAERHAGIDRRRHREGAVMRCRDRRGAAAAGRVRGRRRASRSPTRTRCCASPSRSPRRASIRRRPATSTRTTSTA